MRLFFSVGNNRGRNNYRQSLRFFISPPPTPPLTNIKGDSHKEQNRFSICEHFRFSSPPNMLLWFHMDGRIKFPYLSQLLNFLFQHACHPFHAYKIFSPVPTWVKSTVNSRVNCDSMVEVVL
jgi:hypothetical protein